MRATLKHLKELPEYTTVQPYELYGYPLPDSPAKSNFSYEYVQANVEDARAGKNPYTIEETGFVWTRHPSECPLSAQYFETAEHGNEVVAAYLQETLELVKIHFPTGRAYVMDWRFRRNEPEKLDVKPLRSRARPIASVMHCDYSVDGGLDRLQIHLLPEEIELVKTGQVRPLCVNVWRPFSTVDNAPLLLCDRRSVKKKDLIEIDKVFADKVEKSLYLFARDYHLWHFLDSQTPEEVVIFKSWMPHSDDEIADYPPHGAVLESAGERKPRESVEVRFIVLLQS